LTALSRRAFVGGLTGVGASVAGLALSGSCGLRPFAAQPRLARLGLVWTGSPMSADIVAAYRDGLRDAGWVEGQNLVIEERTHGGDHPERLPDVAAELVALKPEVLLAGSSDQAEALKRATDSIPIVYANATDPVAQGLIASYAHPGGNVTGTMRNSLDGPLGPKMLDLLRQLVPGLTRVVVLVELQQSGQVVDAQAILAAARSVGVDAQAVGIDSPDDVDRALEAAMATHPQALISRVSGGLINVRTNRSALASIMSFALQHAVPTASAINRPPVGGLLGYGPDLLALYRRAASYHVDRILRGARPADLPFEGATLFDLVINRTTARALGLTIPPEVAAQVTAWVE
jgi:putative ABC transport system substrate-binding protein